MRWSQAWSGRSCRRGAYTLIEMLVILVVLGLAAALVVPAVGQADVLKVQSAVRTLVADITFAQSDAVAYQRRRAVLFDLEEESYTLAEVNGATIDPEVDALYDPSGPDDRWTVHLKRDPFGYTEIGSVAGPVVGEYPALIFDELGSPVSTPTGDEATEVVVVLVGSDQVFEVTVEAFTGRVRVERVLGP